MGVPGTGDPVVLLVLKPVFTGDGPGPGTHSSFQIMKQSLQYPHTYFCEVVKEIRACTVLHITDGTKNQR